QALNANAREGLFHLLEFEGLDDGFNFLHEHLLSMVPGDCVPLTRCDLYGDRVAYPDPKRKRRSRPRYDCPVKQAMCHFLNLRRFRHISGRFTPFFLSPVWPDAVPVCEEND